MSIAKEVSDRAAEGRSYGTLGNIYLYLEYYLSIAKEVSDRAAEGRAYGNLGKAYPWGSMCEECTNKWGMPVYEQLEFAKREVEMMGKNS